MQCYDGTETEEVEQQMGAVHTTNLINISLHVYKHLGTTGIFSFPIWTPILLIKANVYNSNLSEDHWVDLHNNN